MLYIYLFVFPYSSQTWRLSHWETGETAELIVPNFGPEEEVNNVDDDEDMEDDDEIKEQAKVTLAILQSGRQLTEEEIIG